MIKGILFDFDDTIIERTEAFREWAHAYLSRTIPAEAVTETLGLMMQLDERGNGSKRRLHAALRERHPEVTADFEAWLKTYQTEVRTFYQPVEGIFALFDRLEAAGTPYGIVTNGSPNQRRKIQHVGLDQRIGCIFVSGIFGVRKPDPAIFQAAAACLGLPPESILFVGDNAEADIAGAHALGMQTAWRHMGRPWPLTDFTPSQIYNWPRELRL